MPWAHEYRPSRFGSCDGTLGATEATESAAREEVAALKALFQKKLHVGPKTRPVVFKFPHFPTPSGSWLNSQPSFSSTQPVSLKCLEVVTTGARFMFWIPRGLTVESLLASELFFLITEYRMEWRFRTGGWWKMLIAGELFLFFDGDGDR